MSAVGLSVIVPTRNRADSVLRLLHGLERQDAVEGGFEVVVVADGCADGTEARVRAARWSFELHVLELPPSGPALARNCGAAVARGSLLLFLDDDVEPAPGVVRAHSGLHRSSERRVGLGYLPPVPSGSGFFAAALRGWWESMFDGPRRPGHRHSFRDLLTGHFSIRAEAFQSLGGFETALSCHEDWEFGLRALRMGLHFTFLPEALAWHHDATNLSKALGRKFDEGVADVQLARMHPDVVPALPLGWTTETARRSRLIRLAWRHPRAGDRLFDALLRLLPLYEHWRLRFRWRALLERALTYWYWRGVAHAIGSERALAALVDQPLADPPAFVIDLADGIAPAADWVDEQRPRSVRVMFRGRRVGDIPDAPGAEPLRGMHLRAALATELAEPLACVLAAEHELPDLIGERVRAMENAANKTRAGASAAFAA